MRTKNLQITIFCIAGITSVTTAIAQVTCATAETTFTLPGQQTIGAWQNPGFWDYGSPSSTKTACIPSGLTAVVYENYCSGGSAAYTECDPDFNCPGGTCVGAACAGGSRNQLECDCPSSTCVTDNEVVAEAVAVDGEVWVKLGNDLRGSSLSIYQDSEVTGTLKIWGRSELRIANDVTISGDGTVLMEYVEGTCALGQGFLNPVGTCDGGTKDGLPCGPCNWADFFAPCPGGTCVPPDPLPVLTLEPDGGNPANLEMRGAWHTCVPIENNGTIAADDKDNHTIIARDGNSGTGFWIAEEDPLADDDEFTTMRIQGTFLSGTIKSLDAKGIVEINVPMSSFAGVLDLTNGTIEVNEDLSGSFDVLGTGGLLKLDADVDTSGDLEFDGGGTIVLTIGHVAAFD